MYGTLNKIDVKSFYQWDLVFVQYRGKGTLVKLCKTNLRMMQDMRILDI